MAKRNVEILLIEDDLPQAELVKGMLAEETALAYAVTHVSYLSDALGMLQGRSFDCVLVDLGLPDSQGLETALSVRRQARRVPVVVLTGLGDEEAALTALQMDMQDYLVKEEITPALLARAIRYAMQRKRVGEELAVAKEQWERTFDSVPDLIAILDDEHKVVRVNRAMAEKLGRPPGELVGMPCYAAFHGTDLPPGFCPHLKEEAASGSQSTEVNDSHLGGHFLVSNTPLLGTGGESLGMVHVARDITELKRAEEEIEELNRTLAARAQELEGANRELEAFTYTAAHDLRQPLNIISGYCQAVEMICGEELDQQCQGYLKDIYRGTLRMSRLIDSLLTFSRMSRVELQKKRVDLSALAHDVAEELKQGDPQRRDVTFRIGSGITVDGDPELIRIVLTNLMGNAWKYTAGAPEPLIEVGATSVAGEPACLVRDNGTGFDMNEAHRLFAAFQRLQGAETRHGFGIGLATVERIIARHGGRVWAQGEPGKGATFYFTLPAEEP